METRFCSVGKTFYVLDTQIHLTQLSGTARNGGQASDIPFCEHTKEHCTCPGKQGFDYILFDQNIIICRKRKIKLYFENLVSFK